MFKKNFKPFLSKLGEPFLSKLGDSIADKALNKFKVVPLEILQKNLKFLRDKACDVEEQIKHAEYSGQKKRKREVEEWLEEVKSIETKVVELESRMESEGFIKRLMDGGKAAQLNERVEHLVEQSQKFGELVIDRFGTKGETLLTSRIVGHEYERNLEKILGLMENEEVLSIGIHGMGGVGKTTLAKGIYNRLLQASQAPVFWVTISQELTVNSLQEKIGGCLNVDLSDEKNEDMRAGKLHKVLSKMKNAVLILDNMWRNIDLLKVGCPFSKECCRLIMTSRSLDVCHQIGCKEVIAVQKLGEYESWNLFNQTLKLGKEIKLSPQVEEIVKYVAKCCDGLPLAIISLAASMRGQAAIHTWRSALAKLKESFAEQDGMREGRVFEVLKYSFDRLNENSQSQSKDFNSVQLCFLHFSLYPEDEEVERNDLIRAFISDGLLDTRKSGRAQYDEGQVILDKLVNVCLLESVGVESDCLKMHDLVRGMALQIVGGKYLVRAGELSLTEIPKEDEWTKDVEKVSLMKTDIRRIENGTSPNCSNLSTLILRESPLEFIPDSFFSKMQGLRNLDLCYTRIMELPDSLSNLKNLQSLLFTGCYRLEHVPNLENLKALRELDLSDTAIKEMPKGLNELLNLKFLSLNEAHNLKAFPRGVLPKLVNLQSLRFPFHLEADMDEMENLKQLEEFTGRCRGSSKCLWDDFSRPRNLRILSIEGCRGTEWIWRSEQSPISSLEFLALKGLEDFKGLIETPGPPQGMFSSLRMLVISKCNKMRKLGLPTWGFPSLESISIEFCEEIQKIFGRGCVTLPKLKELALHKLPRLESVCEVAMVCNSIEEIVVEGCPRLMKKLPVHLDVPLQPRLRKVEVEREWWESLEWDNPHQLSHLLQSSVCHLHLIDRQL